MTRPRLRFNMADAFVALALISAVVGCIVDYLAAVLFAGACGITLLSVGLFRRDGYYIATGGAGTLLSVGRLIAVSTVAIGDGESTLPCTVCVVDASGVPVESATVRIRDVNLHGKPEGVPVHPIPAGEPGVSGCEVGPTGQKLFVSSLKDGSIRQISLEARSLETILISGLKLPGNFALDAARNRLIVPLIGSGRVEVYEPSNSHRPQGLPDEQ